RTRIGRFEECGWRADGRLDGRRAVSGLPELRRAASKAKLGEVPRQHVETIRPIRIPGDELVGLPVALTEQAKARLGLGTSHGRIGGDEPFGGVKVLATRREPLRQLRLIGVGYGRVRRAGAQLAGQ